jgi:hypothetical protein
VNKIQELAWIEISNDVFMKSATSQTNYVRVRWSRTFSGDVRARKGVIRSKELWRSMMENAFLPWYKNEKSWEDRTAQNFTLYEYSLLVPHEVKIRANKILEQTREITLTSVYHTTLDKRLVVDGVHRSIGLQMKLNESESEHIPEVRVLECYGKDVVEMFRCDFIHLIN